MLSCLLLMAGVSSCADETGEESVRVDAADTGYDGDLGISYSTDWGGNEVASDIVAEEMDVPSVDWSVRASVEQIHIWGSNPGTAFVVLDGAGEVAANGTSDDWGSLMFRLLEPGSGYVVQVVDNEDEYVGQLTVIAIEESLPDESFYSEQILEPGFGYLTTRDGTTLSVFISLPGPPEEGPYPTLVNYSGYSPSRPGQPLGPPAALFCIDYPILCDAPEFPSGLIAGIMGFAVVGVNLRGTGCSGGAYDYFEPLQLLDGYDVIEIVARQSWVEHHHVGMIGLSYPGITQLFVASTRPPSLAAIAPFSVLSDTGSSTLLPGGIYNNGFAIDWISYVLDRAVPYGHNWIQEVVDSGDSICEENQLLHSQRLDAVSKAYENPYYTDEVAAAVDPSSFVDQIDVPVFLAGQWQDEQTGPHFPALFDKFTNAPLTRFTVTNGIHMDGFSPQILGEWANFLSLYVAREIPFLSDNLRLMVPMFMGDVFETSLELPPPRFDEYTDYQAALDAYESEQPVRVIFESGALPDTDPGAPQGTFEAFFDEWPIPGTAATRWYFHSDGSLQHVMPEADGGASSFDHDPDAGQRGTLASGSVNHLQPDWDLRQPIPGMAVSFLSEPLADDLVMIGHGSVDLWLQSTADDADIEVCLTEVRPDDMESYVQCGWLRTSHRALREDATELRPVKTHREEDAAPLESGTWNEVRVEIMPFTHIFRAGSRVRMTVDTPGDSMASWRFLLLEYDNTPTHSIAHNADFASSVVLPVIPTIEVPTELPDCHALRGQPCRAYQAFENRLMD